MTRYVLRVDSLIGPITARAIGNNFTEAWNKLKKDMVGVTTLIAIKEEIKIEE
jgi:hypothetical protein